MSATRAFVDGLPADEAALLRFARSGYGHYTTMQVRGGAVRGLGLHLARLEEATRVLFDAALDVDALRAQMHRALDGVADASLRVSIGAANFTARQMPMPARIEVLVLVDPPAAEIVAPVRLMSATYARYLPQIKHNGMFDLFHLRRHARAAGFDDALLVTPEGFVAEGTTFNVGFFSGDALVWPQAALLEGVTMRVLSEVFEVFEVGDEPAYAPSRHSGLTSFAVESRRNDAGGGSSVRVIHQPVTLADVAGFDGGFCCNTGGIWPIRNIDDHLLPCSEQAVQHLRHLLATIPAEPI